MRAWRRTWILCLLFVPACGECGCERASTVHEINGLTLTVRAVHYRGVGVEGAGGHGFGILWPTLEDEGVGLTVQVDERPEVPIGRRSSGDEETLAAAVEVQVSEDAQHIACRPDDTSSWRVLHLLPLGTPFYGPVMEIEGEPDLSAYETPEQIALAMLRGPPGSLGERALLWQALEEQAPSDALDLAVLPHWPTSERAHDIVLVRLRAEATRPFRDAVRERALAEVGPPPSPAPAEYTVPPSERRAALIRAYAVISAHGRHAMGALDDRMIAELSARAQDGLPIGYPLLEWLHHRFQDESPFDGAPPMSEDRKARAVAAGRGMLERRYVREGVLESAEPRGPRGEQDRLAELVTTLGAASDRAWFHDLALASFPTPDPIPTLHVARGYRGAISHDWKARANAAALTALDDASVRVTSTEILLALDAPPPSIDRAFDALLHANQRPRLIRENLEHTSEPWRRRTVAWCVETRPWDREDSLGELRATCLAIAVDLTDCDSARALATDYERRRLPRECREGAPE